MARLWSCGFELNSVVEVTSTAGGPTFVTSPVRSGTYSGRINNTVKGERFIYNFKSTNTADGFYFRFYFLVTAAPAAQTNIFGILDSTPSNKGSVRINTDLTLELWNNEDNAQVGTDSAALALNTWYRIEVKADCTTIGTTALAALIDGVEFASGIVNWANGVDRCAFGHGAADATADYQYDDLAINDDSGSFQNSYPGAGEIIHLRPNAAGDADAWDLTTTFENIDEVTPDDATTIISSLTSNDVHDVNIDDTPAALESTDTITCIQVGVRFNESVGTDPDPTFVTRIKASAAGTVEESGAITASNTAFATNAPAVPGNYALTLYDLPGASTTTWTKADLDTAQIGVRLTNSPIGLAQVSTLWLLVDHAAAAGGEGLTSGKLQPMGIIW